MEGYNHSFMGEKMKYKVCKKGIFKSIQGEGFHSGKSAAFIRLAGCNMVPKCWFCDEKFDEVIELSEQEILDEVKKLMPISMIIITGGEPTYQNLTPLIEILKDNEFFIAIETNGINECDYNVDWIACSPKKEDIKIKKVNELKFVVDKESSKMTKFIDTILSKITYEYVYLQPESNKENRIRECIEMISNNSKLMLSLQIHKFIGID